MICEALCVARLTLLRRERCASGLKVAVEIEIGDECGLARLPSKRFTSALAGCQVIDRCETREPAKVLGSFLRSLADDRYVQTLTDDAGDVAERHSFLGDAAIATVH